MKFFIVFAFVLASSNAIDFRLPNTKLGIINGKKATDGQFPYQVFLVFERDDKEDYCGGSLIDNEWVLTAAHCVESFKTATVFLGATYRTKAEKKHAFNPNDVIAHADYDNKTEQNDIALIKIPFTNYTGKIKPVEFPAKTSRYSNYFGYKAVISGWGVTSEISESLPKNLRWSSLKVIANGYCAKVFEDITSSELCASTFGGIAPCYGDSGGPLVLEGSFIQIGVTSTGDPTGCATGTPEIFMRVTSYIDWIKEKSGISI